MSDNRAPVRMAIRVEGEFVNAYLAKRDTMEGAVLIGSLRRSLAEAGLFDAWKTMMTEAFRQMVKMTLGIDTDVRTERAPEHERGGRA